MKVFRDTIDICGLRDMGYSGSDFTWSRRLGARGWVRECLDRAFVSTNYATMFPTTKLYHVANSVSDHSMLVLKSANPTRKRTKLFCFKSMWLRDERCSKVVNDAWESGRNMGTKWPLLHCLEECHTSLTEWKKHSFDHLGKQITELQKKLRIMENWRGSESILEDTYTMKMKLNRWLNVEEEMWH
ncbi:uncharacterized protein LOC126698256 [Quercus robur]|uniref:uncharacterized protein LOC126698256 n=1 Tax=Quercus robur TaxID=38942 RepID=UPI0021625ED4|nr:uncharacterized protein LOC126698256 [Quercus robur]